MVPKDKGIGLALAEASESLSANQKERFIRYAEAQPPCRIVDMGFA